jgi:hypothetical protein
MRIGIAADHGGFELKQDLRSRLTATGHNIVDFGANRLEPGDDYPDFVTPLARAVASGTVERGVAVCGSVAFRDGNRQVPPDTSFDSPSFRVHAANSVGTVFAVVISPKTGTVDTAAS